MADPRAFISFDFDNDEKMKHLFAGQIKNSRTPFNIEDWSSKYHLPQNQWESLIEVKICKCNLMIVLIGEYTWKAIGVIKEIDFANRNNIPLFGIYVNGADMFTTLPDGIYRRRITIWDWDKIAEWVDRCMA